MRRPPPTLVAASVGLLAVAGGGLLAFGQSRGHAPDRRAPIAPPASTTTVSVPPTTSTTLPPLAPGWVAAENAKPGTSGWRIAAATFQKGAIDGYAGVVSVDRGQPVQLYVSTRAPRYTVQAFRMGYYGGSGARLVWTSASVRGGVQPAPTLDSRVNMVECHWKPSVKVPIDGTWPPGDYLFKLVASTGRASYVPLTIRDDQSTSALLIQNSVTTWEAYNTWGGYSMYLGRTPTGQSFAARARVVSFDRPYEVGLDYGSGDFLGNEYSLVRLAESLGLDVSYTTSLDVDLHPAVLLQHKAFISLGHDEYWSAAMRDAATAARDHGVNLAFLGANAIFRHVRFDSSPLGRDRHEIDYKSAIEDPLNGTDAADVTPNSWREPPNNRPEDDILGGLYQCNPVHADMIVTDPSPWLFGGTGLIAGARLASLVGAEYDSYRPKLAGAPANVEVLAHSPVRCRGVADYADFTYYTAASGAGVIDTGTSLWVPTIGTTGLGVVVSAITRNILHVFAAGPSGNSYPSRGNVASLPPAPALPPGE